MRQLLGPDPVHAAQFESHAMHVVDSLSKLEPQDDTQLTEPSVAVLSSFPLGQVEQFEDDPKQLAHGREQSRDKN